MKGLPRDDILITACFALLFLVLAALAGFYVAGESRRARILFEYQADRLAASLLDTYRATGAPAVTDTRVTAFGIYGAGGEPVVSVGPAPALLRPEEAARPFRYDRAAGTVTLVRPIGAGAPPRGGLRLGGVLRRMLEAQGGMQGPGRAGTVFLRMDAAAYFRGARIYGAATVLAPLLVALVAAGLLVLVAGSVRYRRRGREQEELVRLGESARALAHEIRNPLGAIRMQTALLRRSGGAAHELDVIDEEVERLNLLSRRVGDLLRSPAGVPERIELAGFIRDLARRSPYPVRVGPVAPHVTVSFDPALLRSVVENLTRNAAESYDGHGGETPVEVALDREAGRVTLLVRDRGKGIPPELVEKVFDPFFTDKIHGSGVGLSLSRRFVEAAGGSLTIAAREGGGTEARVTLPAVDAA